MSTLRGRDLISIHDLSTEEVWEIIETAIGLKSRRRAGLVDQPLQGKTLAMIFTKSSTRTRISFEVAMYQLGGYALFLSGNDLQFRRGESISDTAKVLSRYVDGIMIRTFAHQDVLDLAGAATVPIINGLTDLLIHARSWRIYRQFTRNDDASKECAWYTSETVTTWPIPSCLGGPRWGCMLRSAALKTTCRDRRSFVRPGRTPEPPGQGSKSAKTR